MPSQYTFDNNGIGGTPFLSLDVDTTKGRDFTQDDLDNNLTACVVSDSNKIGKGNAGDILLGKVVWVSQQLQTGTTTPALCAVQARGVARFNYDPYDPPRFKVGVVVDGHGKIRGSSNQDITARGAVIAIDTEAQTCDVWLG